LSLLQIVVGTALSVSPIFLPLVTVYTLSALCCLTVFYVYRETHRLARRGNSDIQLPRSNLDVTGWRRFLRGAIVSMAVISIIFSQVFFFVAPRTQGSLWNQGGHGNSLVGFSNQVTLSEGGKRRISNGVVMRVYFERATSGAHYPVYSEPYIEGAVLAKYTNRRRQGRQRGRWEREVQAGNRAQHRLRTWVPTESNNDQARVRIALVPQPQKGLFAIQPAFLDPAATENQPFDIRTDYRTREVYIRSVSEGNLRGKLIHYSLVSRGFRNGIQLPVSTHIRCRDKGPGHPQFTGIRAGHLSAIRHRRLLWVPKGMNGIKAIAAGVVRESKVQSIDRFSIARSLSSYFRASGEFKYTLDFRRLERLRDDRLDPIEDFVVNHKQGDCRFYASALIMMLRSQGIPARMVVGFKADEYNTIGNFYMVRHRHAHAWVEAYLEPTDIPQRLPAANEPKRQGGGWLRLDPSPAAESETTMLSQTGGLMLRARQVMNYLEALWQDYMSGGRRRSSLGQQERGKLHGLNAPLSLGDWFDRLSRLLKALTTGISGIMALGLIAGGGLFLWRWRVRNRRKGKGQQQRGPAAMRVEFFERLERILRKHRLARPHQITPREHAIRIEGELADHTEVVRTCLDRIITSYYRVRFGGEDLDNEQHETIKLALSQLDASLAARTV